MRHYFAAIAIWLATALAVQAQDTALATFRTGDDSRGWEAVGRLDIEGKGFCTATLISENRVLTAAHCLFDTVGGGRIDPARMQFLAGMRNGRATAYRGVRQAIAHPDYVYRPDGAPDSSAHDLAVLELDQPVRLPQVPPMPVAMLGTHNREVGVVSYAQGREDAPSLQQVCAVLGEQSGVLVLSCDVDFGSSGAPVFQMRDGVANVVSVVSAKAMLDDRPVALGAAVAPLLAPIMAALDAGQGYYLNAAPQVLTLGSPGSPGPKFVRP